jgi:hypothetical protein
MMEAVLAEFEPPSPFEPPAWVAGELERPTGKGLVVAVIDSGWDRTCNDPRVLPGVGLVDPEDDLALQENDDDHDRVGHGTACIHQILRIAPDARIVPIRVFGNSLETSPYTLQTAIRIAIERGVNVVNLSLGTRLEGTLKMLYAACEFARRQGIIVVAAGDNSREWSYPAIFENVIGVSAARFDSPYEYRYLFDDAHECQAWGVDQPVVWLRGDVQVKHGTSFAAPNITGIVCLLLERHPGASLEQIRELLARYAIETVHGEPGADDETDFVTDTPNRKPAAKKASAGKTATPSRASKPAKASASVKDAKPSKSPASTKAAKPARASTPAKTVKSTKASASTGAAKPAKKVAAAKSTAAADEPVAKKKPGAAKPTAKVSSEPVASAEAPAKPRTRKKAAAKS